MATNNDKETLFDPPIAPVVVKTKKVTKDAMKKMTPQDMKTVKSVMTLITEIIIVTFIGAMIGAYFNSKAIQTDCERLGVSKVGDAYINCTVVVPHKDEPTVPPR